MYSCYPAIIINTTLFISKDVPVWRESYLILPVTEHLFYAKLCNKTYDLEFNLTVIAPVDLNVGERKDLIDRLLSNVVLGISDVRKNKFNIETETEVGMEDQRLEGIKTEKITTIIDEKEIRKEVTDDKI